MVDLLAERRPRHYAAEIMEMRKLEDRRAALGLVPSHLQDMVKDHLTHAFALRKRS
jgi:hypothetical protein